MTQDLETAIPAIATVVVSVSGVNAPSAIPSDNASEYPFAMVYLLEGEVGNDIEGQIVDLHNIAIDLLVPREWDLTESLPVLHPILDDLKVALFTEVTTAGGGHFDNTVDTFATLRILFLPEYQYAGIEMIGYRLVMEGVKMVTTL
jgi:hypothetical protein